MMYVGAILLFLFGLALIPVAFFVYEEPSCFDGKMNGDERGVDCGGACELLCSAEVLSPTTLWSRAFKVADGVYSLVAYVQNPNTNSETRAEYLMKVYDSRNILIGERRGVTFIPKNTTIAIFEPNFNVGMGVPARVVFEYTNELEWRKNESIPARILVTQNILSQQGQLPRVDGIIENVSDEVLERIEVIAIAYDTQGNAVAASRTFVDRLERNGTHGVSFTWREPFTASRVEIIPRAIPRSL
jgi:hypothetical protein